MDATDDPDFDDEDPLPYEIPSGFVQAAEPPTAEQLLFSKEPSAGDSLVGRSILFHWQVVGWCLGVISSRNTDARRRVEGVVVNFFIHYELDDNESSHALDLASYGKDGPSSWVLLEEA